MARRGARRLGTVLLVVVVAAGPGCSRDDDRATERATTASSSTAPTSSGASSTAGSTTTLTEPDGPEPGADGCGVAAEVGLTPRSIEVDGETRTYVLRVPAGYDPGRPAPLVVSFHGLGSSGAAQLALSRWPQVADRAGVVLVAPDARGLLRGWDFVTPATTPGSDAAFVEALMAEVRATLCIDPARRYANGISNGSAVTFALACSGRPGFAAYAGVAGALSATACGDAPPAPIVYFHGTADPIVPIDGGDSQLSILDPAIDAVATWAAKASCDPDPVVESLSAHVQRHSWTGCTAGVDVVAHVIEGGGHTWPGAPTQAEDPTLGPTTDEIDATEVMWAFFAAHPAP